MRLSSRPGFTVAELLVATAVAGIATALMTVTVVRQQRFYSSAAQVMDVRSQLRDAADILASDIRGAAIGGFGLPVMSDTAIEMFTTIGTSVACSFPAPDAIGLPPASTVSGNTLTGLLAQPDTGDIALVYAIPSGVADSGRWEVYRVSSFGSRQLSSTCPQSSGFTTAADSYAGASGYQLTLTATTSSAVRKGGPIHFLRRARYSFYKSSDGEWYLGYRRCNAAGASACAAIQPVSGPYRPYRRGGTDSGISFRYFDSSGAELTSQSQSTSVARVDIVLRGEAADDIALAGDSRKKWRDSVIVAVSPRNRAR
ncbi:MAG: PilW family protein [Gemmatimonas sp.]